MRISNFKRTGSPGHQSHDYDHKTSEYNHWPVFILQNDRPNPMFIDSDFGFSWYFHVSCLFCHAVCWVFFVSSLFSWFCPLGSVAAGVFDGDRAHPWLTTVSSVFEAAAPEHRCQTITSAAEWLPRSQWNSDLQMLCTGASLWRFVTFESFMITVFSSIGVFPSCIPIKGCFCLWVAFGS